MICYAVGWTQHTTGVQMIRASTIVQLLLGNIGRPGGGILALRGHASIQGSTDIPTLYNLLPGYLNIPSALKSHETLADYIKTEISPTSYWANFPNFIVSLLKAWYGEAATKENDWGYDWLPKIVGDHSHMPMFVAMAEGQIKGFMAMGQNPAVGGQNAGYQRKALAKLDWMVVKDLYETETATFWKDSPEVHSGELKPEAIATEVFLLPAAATAEMDGTYTNTQRLLQWHDRAVRPARRRPVRPLVHRPARPPAQEALRRQHARARPADPGPHLGLHRPRGERRAGGSRTSPRPAGSSRRSTGPSSPTAGRSRASATSRPTARPPAGPGSTAASTPRRPRSPTATTSPPTARGTTGSPWAGASPGRPTAGSCTTGPRPTPRATPGPRRPGSPRPTARASKGYVYWDADWRGPDPAEPDQTIRGAMGRPRRPRLPASTSRPTAPAKPDGMGLDFHDGASPFIMKADGKGWLFAPSGAVDGPAADPLRALRVAGPEPPPPGQQSNPVGQGLPRPGQPLRPAGLGRVSRPCSRPIG